MGISISGKKLIEALPLVSLVVGGVGICITIVLVVAGVIARTVFNASVPGSIEFSEYLIPIVCFWGAAYTLRENGHVNADLLIHRLPKKIKQWIVLIGYILGLPYLLILAFYVFKVVLDSFEGNYVSMYPLQTPLGYPQLLVCLGLILFSLQLVIEIVRKVRELL